MIPSLQILDIGINTSWSGIICLSLLSDNNTKTMTVLIHCHGAGLEYRILPWQSGCYWYWQSEKALTSHVQGVVQPQYPGVMSCHLPSANLCFYYDVTDRVRDTSVGIPKCAIIVFSVIAVLLIVLIICQCIEAHFYSSPEMFTHLLCISVLLYTVK